MASRSIRGMGHRSARTWVAGVLWLTLSMACTGEQKPEAGIGRRPKESVSATTTRSDSTDRSNEDDATPQLDLSSDRSLDVLDLNVDVQVERLEKLLLAYLETDLQAELAYVQRVCKLTDDECDEVDLVAQRWLKAAARIHAMVRTPTRTRRSQPPGVPNPRELVKAVVDKVVSEELSPSQAESYRAEKTSRIDDYKRAGVLSAVARLDEDLMLTSRQRQDLIDALASNWEPDWLPPFETMLFNSTRRIELPDNIVLPLLTPAQKSRWQLVSADITEAANPANSVDLLETRINAMHIRLQLDVETAQIVCGLSEQQTQKLLLAGQGGIDQYARRAKNALERQPLIARGQQFPTRKDLQSTLAEDPFGEGTLFQKVRKRTLGPEQVAACEQEQADRARFRYEAKLAQIVAVMDGSLRLRDEQRHKLEALFLAETKPPDRFGRYDYYVLLYQASEMPEHKIRPIFDDIQWIVVRGQFAKAKEMGAALRRAAYLPTD